MGIQGMVTRTGWSGETWGANQRVTVDEALRINTLKILDIKIYRTVTGGETVYQA
jgi:hypothetical protein